MSEHYTAIYNRCVVRERYSPGFGPDREGDTSGLHYADSPPHTPAASRSV
jgi:hypothetical protein